MIVRATTSSESSHRVLSARREVPDVSCMDTTPMEGLLLQIVQTHGDKILLKESDRTPKTSKKKGKRKPSEGLICKERRSEKVNDWQGLPPWDLSLGGDGRPKFLCDVMVSGSTLVRCCLEILF